MVKVVEFAANRLLIPFFAHLEVAGMAFALTWPQIEPSTMP